MKIFGRETRGGAVAAVVCLLALGASAASVAVDSDCDGMGTVAVSEKRLANGNSQLTLKATAADGFAFEGWSVAERDVVAWPDDRRHPGPVTPTVVSNAEIRALFVACADDGLSFDISGLLPDEIDCGEDIAEVLSVDSVSFPTVKLHNLPHGLSFKESTLTVFGKPDVPGVYRIEAEAVNESGFTFSSFCTVRVRNLEGARVSGMDTEISVGEYFYTEVGGDDISDVFSFSEAPTSVTLAGTVPGLSLSNNWSVIYGTPTKIGDYTLKVTATFPTGRVETATMTLSVVGVDPDEYDLDLDVFENLQVGDALDEQIGSDTSDYRIASVAGLPTGLSVTFRYEEGARRCFVSGTVRKPGFFAVTVQVEDRSGETSRTVTVGRTILVEDAPDAYLAVQSADPELGTVSGGGAVSPVDDVTLVASPHAGSVFAGWYDPDGDPLALRENVDYRTARVVLPAGTDFAFLTPVAHFVSAEDEIVPDLSDLEDDEFSFAPDETFETEFSVDSQSLPTLTFKGLPQGMSCVATGTGEFILSYDPETGVAASKRHTVTVTAVNAAGKKSSAKFLVTVKAQSDERVRVYDDYGEFTPGEEIYPIDLSDAVDFAQGETLSVSGLPKGLSYNAKENGKTGVEAHTITGTPTVPGNYTLTFTAKVIAGEATNRQGKVSSVYETARATAFLTVLPYPELEIDVDEDAVAAGCKVTGAGNYKSGTKVSLKATAAKGWVFAGWDGLDEVEGLAALNPKLSYETGEDDVWAQACFVPVSDDGLTVHAPELTDSGFAAEWPYKGTIDEDDATLIADLIETVSWPTVKVTGLPNGVKFSSTTFLLSGAPTKSGVCHVTVTAKNAGGYSFVRVFDVAVLEADGTVPEEEALENRAEIDFAPLKGLTTGVYCPTGAVVLAIGPKPGTPSPVGKVSVSGLPAGLSAAVTLRDDGAAVEVTGTPTKPGRQTVAFSVTYADGKSLKSRVAIVVEDGGSAYLFVATDDPEAGTVSGEGVYASGATVKLVARAKAKHVFAGWHATDDAGTSLFGPLRDIDGIDPRTASVAFPFRPGDFSAGYERLLTGAFAPMADDGPSEIELESDTWNVDPSAASSFAFSVDSLSVPKVTVKGLPKGVSVDAARGLMTYTPSAATAPGVYTATVSAKNATQKKATAQAFEIQVANRVSDVIVGLDPAMDAYALSIGTTLDPSLIAPTAAAGWKLTAKGLPSGLSFKNGVVTGVPSKAGTYTVTFTATSGKGKGQKTETATITLRVTALPATLAGTFTGVLTEPVDAFVSNASEEVVGAVTVTATAAGKVTVAAQTPAKKYTFTAKSWDAFTNGVATVRMTDKGGASCVLSVEATDDWQSWQATGEVVPAAGEAALNFEAQRNPYGAKDGFGEARAAAEALKGKSTIEGWTVEVKANGAVRVSGKYAGKGISGSTVLQWSEGIAFARYVKFIDKKTEVCLVFVFGDDGKVAHMTTN